MCGTTNMKKLEKSERSRGIVAFALNTSTTDYLSIANKTLDLASKILDLPHTIITNLDDANFSNSRFDIDLDKFVQWRNFGRHSVYDLSPYDETLVIDADYLVLNNELLKIFDLSWDYILQRKSHALTTTWPDTMGDYSHPYVWATVFAFRKTDRAKMYFDLIERIQKNYQYYRLLFNINERIYRNDYAFAIADIILNGYSIDTKSIPGSMLSIENPIQSLSINNNQIIVKDKKNSYVLPMTNLHVMSKSYLSSDNFESFYKQIIHELA
jgi:hypothetical protein